MRAQHIDALIVPSADPHLSEYLPARWQGRHDAEAELAAAEEDVQEGKPVRRLGQLG